MALELAEQWATGQVELEKTLTFLFDRVGWRIRKTTLEDISWFL